MNDHAETDTQDDSALATLEAFDVEDGDVLSAEYLIDPPEVLPAAYLETEAEAEAWRSSADRPGATAASAETMRLRHRPLMSDGARRAGSAGSSRRSNGGNGSLRESARPSGPKSAAQIRHEKTAKFIVYGGFVLLTILFFVAAIYKFWDYLAPLLGMGG